MKRVVFALMLVVFASGSWVVHAGPAFDIDNDGRTGLAEAIYILQIVSGLHPEATSDLDQLDSPTSVQASDGASVENIRITWQSVPIAADYTIYRFDVGQNRYIALATSTDTYYVDSDVNVLERYYYKVRAHSNLKGYSLLSDYDSGFRGALLPPGSSSASVGVYDDRVMISWQSALGSDEYIVYRSEEAEGVYQEIGRTSEGSFADSSANPLTMYSYKVRSHNSNLDITSDYSNPISGYRLQSYQLIMSVDGYLGQLLRYPYGLAAGKDGDIYLADQTKGAIVVFDSNGAYKKTFMSGLLAGSLRGLAFDSSGNLYVADSAVSMIRKFDKDGNQIGFWGSTGAGQGQFNWLRQITMDSSDHLYVVDYNNHRVQVFDSRGNFIRMWGGYGAGQGKFNRPWGIAIDSAGYVYVSDSLEEGNPRIQQFDNQGNFIRIWKNMPASHIVIDHNGDLFVSTAGGISKFSPSGKLMARLVDGFDYAQGVVVTDSGRVFGLDNYGDFQGLLVFDPND